MENQLNTGSIDTLKAGDTLLVEAKQVNGGKVQIEFAEVIQTNTVSKGINLLGLINKSDDRFSSNARRAWMVSEAVDIGEAFGIDLGPNASWYAKDDTEFLELNVLNPTAQGYRARIVVTETIEPTEYQAANIERKAKRKGKEGDYITHDGNYIFSNTTAVLTNENTTNMHVFLAPDSVGVKTAAPTVGVSTEFDDVI